MSVTHPPTISPFSIFQEWLQDAASTEISDPDAACLATVDRNGLPNTRIILVRKIDTSGFCFFTNYDSAKGEELMASGLAALNFHWKTQKRQVRIRGNISKMLPEESDSYYQSRPLGNRIGAWASIQSRPMKDKSDLLERVDAFEKKFGEFPPRPDHWGGFRLAPISIEFWQEGACRLHDRIRYTKQGDSWQSIHLYP